MIITYDSEADAAYIYLKQPVAGDASRTITCDEALAAGSFHLDIDQDGRLIGIEILNAKRALPSTLLDEAVPAATICMADLQVR